MQKPERVKAALNTSAMHLLHDFESGILGNTIVLLGKTASRAE